MSIRPLGVPSMISGSPSNSVAKRSTTAGSSRTMKTPTNGCLTRHELGVGRGACHQMPEAEVS